MFKHIILVLALFVSTTSAKDISAQSWLVTDYKGKIIDGENYNQVRSIASISKLVTTMIVLDAGQSLTEKIENYTRSDLIKLALIRSDNRAANLLCQHYPGGSRSCVFAMNEKVRKLGLSNTKFVEPTGLSVFNVSTAEELVDIVLEAEKYQEILEAARSNKLKVKVRKKWIVFNNTNPIIGKRHDVIVSKTGYIKASGGCLVMMLDTELGRRIIVVLGSKNTKTRIPEAEFLINTY